MNEKNWFNKLAKDWAATSDENLDIANHLIKRIGIKKDQSVCDVGAGTGILYCALKDLGISNYLAIDISEGMISKFVKLHGNLNIICKDFEEETFLEDKFDYVIIFNSIPHFYNLKRVFENAYNNLNFGGKFVIAHSKTRQGLKEHHMRIGYKSDRENLIPLNGVLIELGKNHGFENIEIQDEGYFYFNCEK